MVKAASTSTLGFGRIIHVNTQLTVCICNHNHDLCNFRILYWDGRQHTPAYHLCADGRSWFSARTTTAWARLTQHFTRVPPYAHAAHSCKPESLTLHVFGRQQQWGGANLSNATVPCLHQIDTTSTALFQHRTAELAYRCAQATDRAWHTPSATCTCTCRVSQ